VWAVRWLWVERARGGDVHRDGLVAVDLVEARDRAVINDEALLQSHLFEDRMLKASGLRVGADWTVGAGSVVLYDAEMEDGSRLDALSLLMKGERLPAGTAWAGSPAKWQTARPGGSEDRSLAEAQDQGRRFPTNGLCENTGADRVLQPVN